MTFSFGQALDVFYTSVTLIACSSHTSTQLSQRRFLFDLKDRKRTNTLRRHFCCIDLIFINIHAIGLRLGTCRSESIDVQYATNLFEALTKSNKKNVNDLGKKGCRER
jgi:hypothetical protein